MKKIDRVRKKVYESFKDEASMNLLMVTMEHTPSTPFNIDPEVDDAEETADTSSAEAFAMKYGRFDGGQTTVITLSTEVAMGTISDMLSDAIEGISTGEGSKYPDRSATATASSARQSHTLIYQHRRQRRAAGIRHP